MNVALEKPSHDNWLYWSEVVIDRLSTCVKVYAKPPLDVFISEKDLAEKKEKVLDLLRRIYALTDSAETPTDSLADVAHHDERSMAGLAVLLRETLDLLPSISGDMQKLLKSSWGDNFPSRVAAELFAGPQGKINEGIGSGYPENGRLPEALKNLLEREQIGDNRVPRQSLHRNEKDASGVAEGTTGETPKRWNDRRPAAYRRSAGQVD